MKQDNAQLYLVEELSDVVEKLRKQVISGTRLSKAYHILMDRLLVRDDFLMSCVPRRRKKVRDAVLATLSKMDVPFRKNTGELLYYRPAGLWHGGITLDSNILVLVCFFERENRGALFAVEAGGNGAGADSFSVG